MRIRTIKPEFWAHPVMGRQSDATKLLAIGLLNHADDYGYFLADPAIVRSALRPFDDSSENVRRSLQELSRTGYIELREHPTHGAIGKITSFEAHQRVDKPKASTIKALFEFVDSSKIDPRTILSGREGKGKEYLKPELVENAEKTQRPRNPVFDALAALDGWQDGKVPSALAGRVAKAMKSIREVCPNVTAEEIEARAERYQIVMPKGSMITSTALAANWGKCEPVKEPEIKYVNNEPPLC